MVDCGFQGIYWTDYDLYLLSNQKKICMFAKIFFFSLGEKFGARVNLHHIQTLMNFVARYGMNLTHPKS